MISQKLADLREKIKQAEVDGYIIPRADEYQGEFVAPYAERLGWLSGFTGSAGYALVLQEYAVVMSDGRYSVQLKNEVNQECFELADSTKTKMVDWLQRHGVENSVIGYDPYLHTAAQIKTLEDQGLKLKSLEQNLVDEIWSDQPKKPLGKIEVFPDDIAGLTAREKIEKVVDELKKSEVVNYIFAAPDSICWLLNVRGADVDNTPYILSTLLLVEGEFLWFVNEKKLSSQVLKHLPENMRIISPKNLSSYIQRFNGCVGFDEAITPIAFKQILKNSDVWTKNVKDPCVLMRACKTSAEIQSIRRAHIEDGAALVRFMMWLEESNGEDEYSVGQKLGEFRAQSSNYIRTSFPAICGFAENGAIIHYRADKQTAKSVEGDGLLLVDSGGQYHYGTTDITRTFLIGDVPHDIKEHFTRVLKGHIALANAKFPYGTTGVQLDVYARQSLWDAGLDYAHGTGHGVGCYLDVHEQAANISPRSYERLEPRMLLSNEPGYYKEGSHGIRIENLILVQEDEGTSDCKMLGFDTVSFAPIEKDLILKDLLSCKELDWLNSYHRKVYNCLKPKLSDIEQAWLSKKTSAL